MINIFIGSIDGFKIVVNYFSFVVGVFVYIKIVVFFEL